MDKIAVGIHLGHDRGASLVKNGKLIAHIAQDRIDRIKHSEFPLIPFEAIDAILHQTQLKSHQIQSIGISVVGDYLDIILESIVDDFKSHYRIKSIEAFGVQHHMAHAYATFYTSNFEESLILVSDGGGDLIDGYFEGETLFKANKDGVELLKRRLHEFGTIFDTPQHYKYPVMPQHVREKQMSIGHKYEQFTFNLGFRLNQDGKTMGLSSYGNGLLDFEKFTYHDFEYSIKAEDILNDLEVIRLERGLDYHDFFKAERANLAATIQDFTEDALFKLCTDISEMHDNTHLSVAGGVFLNCVANQKLLKKKIFKEMHFLPACGDDGQSLGAAFYAYLQSFGRIKPDFAPIPYLGVSYSDLEIERVLMNAQFEYNRVDDSELSLLMAEAIAEGQVVGLLRGRSELGPRALGHRSIIADPRATDIKDRLNSKVKLREQFRPYAPMVAKEFASDIFDLVEDSPHMLLAVDVNPEYQQKLPGITHADGTARVQTLGKEDDSFLHDLLLRFGQITGLPVLLNTSFNLAGDPMVESPKDALTAFIKMKIDMLVIGSFVLHRKEQSADFHNVANALSSLPSTKSSNDADDKSSR